MSASDLPFSRRGLLGAVLVGTAAAGLAACGNSSSGQAPAGGSSDNGSGGDGSPGNRPSGDASSSGAPSGSGSPSPAASSTTGNASPAQMLQRATVPVLCYHQVRPYEAGDTSYNKQLLIVEPARFREQLDAIEGAGYTTITPAEYLAHLTGGQQLPDKPVMLSFDDGKDNQPGTALPAVLERGMKATWFIMTVVVDNTGWTTKAQIKQMADAGITIGGHTWDHHDVRKYTAKDFTTQFEEPRKKLQDISGQPVETFAFPYGAWNEAALPHLEKAGYRTAFQLADKPVDRQKPLLTLRRSLVDSGLSGAQMVARLEQISKKS